MSPRMSLIVIGCMYFETIEGALKVPIVYGERFGRKAVISHSRMKIYSSFMYISSEFTLTNKPILIDYELHFGFFSVNLVE